MSLLWFSRGPRACLEEDASIGGTLLTELQYRGFASTPIRVLFCPASGPGPHVASGCRTSLICSGLGQAFRLASFFMAVVVPKSASQAFCGTSLSFALSALWLWVFGRNTTKVKGFCLFFLIASWVPGTL